MDGRGRIFDNIFIERLWRTDQVRVYLLAYSSRRLRPGRGIDHLFPLLQHDAPPSGRGVSDSSGSPFRDNRINIMLRIDHYSKLTYFWNSVVLTMGSNLSPWENGYVESLIGKLRDKILNSVLFFILREALALV